MAEGQEDRAQEDLTEEASPHRIEEFRQKGQVAQSREINSLVAFLAIFIAIYIYAPSAIAQLIEFMREFFSPNVILKSDLSRGDLMGVILKKVLYLASGIALPICTAGFIVAVISSFSQVGGIFSFDPIQPSFDKINPLSGLKRFFSSRQLFEGARILFKMSILVSISVLLVQSVLEASPSYFSMEAPVELALFGSIAGKIFSILALVLIVFATADFFLQRFEHQKKLRMTKQEAKKEHKEREGDPHIKARIRSIQREMARRRMMKAVKEADVIVTNPTHIAVALKYDRENMDAPKVIAKGADHLAQRIKKIASEVGVPQVENVPLARTLYKTVKEGQYIPKTLYQAVAEVLAYVYRLKNQGF